MNKKQIINDKWAQVYNKAEKIDCWYVMCAFISPITQDVSFRIGYFEERHDAEQWISTLVNRYKDLKVPYYITSNTMDYTIGDMKAFIE